MAGPNHNAVWRHHGYDHFEQGKPVFPIHPGVYSIRNTITGEMYIGGTMNIYGRWRFHRSMLRRGVHTNHKLQAGWSNDGEAAFVFEVIESLPRDKATVIDREEYWMNASKGRLYNLSEHAIVGLGRACSETTKAINRARMMGNKIGMNSGAGIRVSDARVVEIASRFASGENADAIAKDFSISRVQVTRIAGRKSRQQVVIPIDVEQKCRERLADFHVKGGQHPKAKLDESDVRNIRQRHAEGSSYNSLSPVFGVSAVLIRKIVKRELWKHVA